MQFIIVFCHTHYGILVLLSILVTVVLCNDALYSKCLEQLLLRQFIIVFCHTHCGIMVLLWILVIMVLCTVALCSKCLEYNATLHNTTITRTDSNTSMPQCACQNTMTNLLSNTYFKMFKAIVAKVVYHCILPYTLWHTGITVDSCYCGFMQCCIVL